MEQIIQKIQELYGSLVSRLAMVDSKEREQNERDSKLLLQSEELQIRADDLSERENKVKKFENPLALIEKANEALQNLKAVEDRLNQDKERFFNEIQEQRGQISAARNEANSLIETAKTAMAEAKAFREALDKEKAEYKQRIFEEVWEKIKEAK